MRFSRSLNWPDLKAFRCTWMALVFGMLLQKQAHHFRNFVPLLILLVVVLARAWVRILSSIVSRIVLKQPYFVGAPVGSCLVGSAEFIFRARWLRKLFGGGMRQTGILAGAAAYALSHNFELLPRVHDLTRRLEQGLRDIGVSITSPAETCMVTVHILEYPAYSQRLACRSSTIPLPSVWITRR